MLVRFSCNCPVFRRGDGFEIVDDDDIAYCLHIAAVTSLIPQAEEIVHNVVGTQFLSFLLVYKRIKSLSPYLFSS
jgi:hypothetical protein